MLAGIRGIATAGLLALALAVTGCASDESPASAPAPPQRIVSMTPAMTEILFALGVGERVVGVTRFCDWPPEARTRPQVGGYADPSVEAVLALRPDLVLVSPAGGNRDAGLALQRAGVRLEVVPAETLQETYASIRRVAELCGVRERGARLVRDIEDRIARAAARVAGRPRPRTLLCLELQPLIVAGRGTLPAQLVELAGGDSVVEAERYPRLAIEALLETAPEVILQTRVDLGDAAAARDEALRFWRRWPGLPAVRDGRVHVVDATPALRPGPRVGEAVEALAALLHPEQGS